MNRFFPTVKLAAWLLVLAIAAVGQCMDRGHNGYVPKNTESTLPSEVNKSLKTLENQKTVDSFDCLDYVFPGWVAGIDDFPAWDLRNLRNLRSRA